MIATIVNSNSDTAQLMFLIAAIVSAVLIVVGIVEHTMTPVFWAACILVFLSLGLLFST